MPRKNPLPDREMAICKRVREIRESLKLSQVNFAKALVVDSSIITSIEHCRAPLRYELADKICRTFNVNQSWLAHGAKYFPGPYINMHGLIAVDVSERMLFSEAYDNLMYPLIQSGTAQLADQVHYAAQLWLDKAHSHLYIHPVVMAIKDALGKLPIDLHPGLLRSLAEEIQSYTRKHSKKKS